MRSRVDHILRSSAVGRGEEEDISPGVAVDDEMGVFAELGT